MQDHETTDSGHLAAGHIEVDTVETPEPKKQMTLTLETDGNLRGLCLLSLSEIILVIGREGPLFTHLNSPFRKKLKKENQAVLVHRGWVYTIKTQDSNEILLTQHFFFEQIKKKFLRLQGTSS